MDQVPDFHIIAGEHGQGVTYTCGCPCTPTAWLAPGAGQTFEHCCCGKVHFAGPGAIIARDVYLADRRATRKREPEYALGATTVPGPAGAVEVAWAFPQE